MSRMTHCDCCGRAIGATEKYFDVKYRMISEVFDEVNYTYRDFCKECWEKMLKEDVKR